MGNILEEIILNDFLRIGEGNSRICYDHPSDNTKVLKISKHNLIKVCDNELEYKYFTYLRKKDIPILHLSNNYGFVETNLGIALVCDKICNYDGTLSKSLKDVIGTKLLKQKEDMLIIELRDYIFKYNILFLDVNLSNILCCEYEKDKYKLIIIDGIGTARDAFRLKMYFIFNWYSKYKIKKQWKKFIHNIEKLKNEKI